jgi:hypothetical protein
MQLLFTEVLQKVEDAKTRNDKIDLLRRFSTEQLQTLIRLNFDLTVKMDLPPGNPPYTFNDAPAGTEHSLLYNEVRKMYIWLDPKCAFNRAKKEHMFIQMLEGLHKDEAELMLLCKNNMLQTKYNSISPELIREAYPGLPLPSDDKIARVLVESTENQPKKRGRKPKNLV